MAVFIRKLQKKTHPARGGFFANLLRLLYGEVLQRHREGTTDRQVVGTTTGGLGVEIRNEHEARGTRGRLRGGGVRGSRRNSLRTVRIVHIASRQRAASAPRVC